MLMVTTAPGNVRSGAGVHNFQRMAAGIARGEHPSRRTHDQRRTGPRSRSFLSSPNSCSAACQVSFDSTKFTSGGPAGTGKRVLEIDRHIRVTGEPRHHHEWGTQCRTLVRSSGVVSGLRGCVEVVPVIAVLRLLAEDVIS